GSSQKEETAAPEKTTVGEIQQSKDKDLKKKSQLITAGRTDKKPTARKSEDNLVTKPGQHQTEYLYALQIASLESEIKAADMVSRLESLGYPAYFYKSYIKGKAFYRVRCGPFKNEKEAGDFKKLLHKRENIESFISKIAK
ncbi:MAG TPA: SPOR domain-containing protein, partial [Desulfobacteraceae bacterium]|nr:SPOR domain-containing protein [Desulfobacteraceae bacterium]